MLPEHHGDSNVACLASTTDKDAANPALETLSFVLPSRYCEVDSELLDFAWQNFGATPAWMGAGADDLRLRPWPSPLRLPASSRQSHRARKKVDNRAYFAQKSSRYEPRRS